MGIGKLAGSALVALVAASASAACVSKSSGSSGPEPSFDAGTFDVTFADDVAPSPDGGTARDALASCQSAASPDGSCNTVQELVTMPITGTCGAGPQPAGTGGTVVDGTYVLGAQERFVDAGCTAATFEATMRVTGGCFERVDTLGGTDLRRNGTFETSGTTLTRTATCGAALPAATYTATATTITIFDEGGSVTTWTKQ